MYLLLREKNLFLFLIFLLTFYLQTVFSVLYAALATGQIVVQQKNQRQFYFRATGPPSHRLSPPVLLYNIFACLPMPGFIYRGTTLAWYGDFICRQRSYLHYRFHHHVTKRFIPLNLKILQAVVYVREMQQRILKRDHSIKKAPCPVEILFRVFCDFV